MSGVEGLQEHLQDVAEIDQTPARVAMGDDVDSVSDYPEEARSFRGFSAEDEARSDIKLVKTVSNALSEEAGDGNVLTRLSTLSKRLSQMTAKQVGELDLAKEDFSLQNILHYMNNKFSEQGLRHKATGVQLEDVTVLGIDDSTAIVTTAGDIFGAPFLGPKRAIFDRNSKAAKVAKKTGDDKYRQILRKVNALVEPGEMCLVLGRPGAGCSSFLKTVAGETDAFVRVDGDVNYNNIPQHEMVKRFKRDLIYNPELDVHYPHLTVDQTLKFAIGCRTPAIRIDNFSRDKYIETVRDIWATVFGLTHTLHTKVGNDFVRGVSGGERKRVSIAEAVVTRGAVYCWDNATRGLDASTALEYAEAIRTSTSLSKTTSFVTIYQAGEGIYEKFDKVTVLYQGHQIYFGPAVSAKQYFIDMGFECPARQSTAEFLTAITDPIGRFPRPGFASKVPRTAAEFEDYWLKSPEFAELKEQLVAKKAEASSEDTAKAFQENMVQEKMRGESKTSRYTVNFWEQLKLCFRRDVQNIIGDKSYTVTAVSVDLIQSLIIGSLFYNISDTTAGAFSRGGVCFFAVLYFSLMALAEVATTFTIRPILMKQKGYSFYHPSAEVLSSTATSFPLKFASIVVFSIVVYFLTHLKVDPGAFFTFVLFIVLTSQTIRALFRMLATATTSVSSANAIAGISMMACVLYSSYMVQRSSMHPWFKWLSYMNPILYGFEAMITTEFHGRKMECGSLVPSGPGYEDITSANQVCGFSVNEGLSYVGGDFYVETAFSYNFSHVWRNFGILILFWIAFLLITCLLSERLKPVKDGGDHLLFIRGAHIPDSIVGPESDAESSSSGDAEKGPTDSFTVEQEVDNTRSKPDEAELAQAALGSDEIFMWKNIDYVIPYEGSERKLLDNVQGYVKPGTLTALMGESGAGKTTLLNTLSQRIDMGVITGDMLVNGKPITSSFTRRTGYVQQQDVHISELTVRESLQFAARLRRPASVSDKEKLEYVEQVMDILRMQDYADALAGEPGFGLNVEQRKKLSIATELVAKPSLLLFLDEPTSGLDSQSAWAIVQILRDLAKAGQAILCTIHQPSATLFEAFDKLLLLRKGGQTVYFGDIGQNSDVILDYFEANGARKCDRSENPAEYILEAIGAGATAAVTENWFEKWTQSPQFEALNKEVDELIAETSNRPIRDTPELADSTYAMSYLYQFQLVLRRTATQFYRDTDYIMSKFMLMTIAGLFIGFTYWNVKHTVIGMQNAMFAVFISVILSAPLSNQIQAKAISSRETFEVRESKSNTFHWSVLLISQVANELPYSFVFSTIFFIAWYFTIQLDNEASRMGVYWLNYCIFFQTYYVSLALFTVYAAPDLPSANVLISFFMNLILSFCGVAQPERLMPGFWTFMYKVSPYTYFLQSLIGTILHGRPVKCGASEYAYVDPPSGQTCAEYLDPFLDASTGYVHNPNDTSNCGYCEYTIADEYLNTLGIKFSYRWRNVGFYCVYIGFNVVAMLGLYYIFRVRKFSLGKLMPKFGKKK